MEKKIIIFYLHEDFVNKLLTNIYPNNFKLSDTIPKNGTDIIISTEDEVIKINMTLGLNRGYNWHLAEEIIIEDSLITKETISLVNEIEKEKSVKVYNIKDF